MKLRAGHLLGNYVHNQQKRSRISAKFLEKNISVVIQIETELDATMTVIL